MDIQARKIYLIEYLARLQDELMISKLEKLIGKEAYEANLKPMSLLEFNSRIQAAEKAIQEGKITTVEDLEEESENW